MHELSTHQKGIAREVLQNFKSKFNSNQDQKSLELFNELVERGRKRPLTFAKAVKKYATTPIDNSVDEKARAVNSKSFNTFLDRLYEKILDAQVLSFNTDNDKEYDPQARAEFQGRKKFIQVRLLWGKGLTDQGLRKLKSIIKQAKQYEIYPQLIEALTEYRFALIALRKVKEADEISKDIERNKTVWDDFQEARAYHYQVQRQLRASSINPELMGLLFNATETSKGAAARSGSAGVRYYNLLLFRELYKSLEQFPACVEAGTELVQLVEASPALRDWNKRGMAFASLGESCWFVYDFETALWYFRKSKDVQKAKSMNRLVAMEFEARSLFYLGKVHEAAPLLTKTLKATPKNTPAYYLRQYYLACCYFCQQDYQKAFRLFESLYVPLGKDKSGWNLGLRIMMILSSIELQRLDFAASQIESLRKYVPTLPSAYDSPTAPREREQVISSVLSRLARKSFDFDAALQSSGADMKKLDSFKKDLRWEPNTHELVIFQSWLNAKLRDEPYKFTVPESLTAWMKSLNKKQKVKYDFRLPSKHTR